MSKTVHVAIDTTVLREDPLRRRFEFLVLERLSKKRQVKLYVPHMVKMEFVSQETQNHIKRFQRFQTSLNKILRNPPPDGRLANEISRLEALVESNFDRLSLDFMETLEADFDHWLERIGGACIPVENEHTEKAWDAYFKGQAPCKSVRDREGIPDAFIAAAIRGLESNGEGKLHFVTNDDKLADSFGDGIKVHKSLKSFFEVPAVRIFYKDVVKEQKIERAVGLNSSKIEASIASLLLDELPGKDVYGIPYAENSEGSIDAVGEPTELEFEEVEYYGEGLAVLPFGCSIELLVSFFIFKSDYFTFSDDIQISGREWNEHFFISDRDFEFYLRANLTIKTDQDLLETTALGDEEGLFDLIESAEISIESIDIEALEPYEL